MNAVSNDGALDEASLVKLYMDLTGMSEASARSVYMFISGDEAEKEHKSNGLDLWRTGMAEPENAMSDVSPASAEREQEFGLGLLATEGIAITGK